MKRYMFFFIIIFFCLVSSVSANNKSVVDITELTMNEQIDYLDKGVITSYELVNLYLDRINTYNDTFKALITINPNILDEAKEMDELRQKGEIKGKLHGIPIIVKDNIDVKGMPTTAGAKALADNYPIEDAEVIKKLKAEGAIIIGKANMSEFAFSARDSKSSYGYVSNAFRVGYTSYGSSGGSAVALALSFGSVALGTDTNSSVRLPSAAAGLVGLRPSTGKLSNDGVIAYDINRDTVGVISKSVEDNELIMEILTGEAYDTEIKETIRIGVPRSFYEGGSSSIPANKKTWGPIKTMLDDEIERLKSEGIEIVFLDDYFGDKEQSYNTNSIAGYTMCRAFNNYIKGTTGQVRSFKQLANSGGKITGLKGYLSSCNYSDKDFANTLSYQNKLKKYISKVYEEYDLDYIMYPVTKNEIYKKNENDKLLNVSTTVASTVGYPAIVVPLGYYDGMPYGLELMAKVNEEDKLYSIASVIEKHNNLINKQETAAPKLYEVSDDVKDLVKLYVDNYDNQDKQKWIKEVYDYFRNYNNLENSDEIARSLIEKFDTIDNDVLLTEENLIMGLCALNMIILPYSIKLVNRRKRINNILYYSKL